MSDELDDEWLNDDDLGEEIEESGDKLQHNSNLTNKESETT